MRLVSFTHNRRQSVGLMLDETRLLDLGARLAGECTTLVGILTDGEARMREIAALGKGAAADLRTSEIAFDPVVPSPHAIWCVGLNYMSHREETNHWGAAEPTLFQRIGASQVGHLQPLIKPSVSDQFDYEGELAVVIGKPGRHIPEDRAMEFVGGYSCYNEGSVRDWQKHSPQYTPGKNFGSSGSFGPWLVTPDEFGDPNSNQLTTRLNGEVVQDSSIELMIFKIPKLISYLSKIYQLRPGDVIVTGTPAGVGSRRVPQRFLRSGDTLSVEISNIGTLSNPVVDEVLV